MNRKFLKRICNKRKADNLLYKTVMEGVLIFEEDCSECQGGLCINGNFLEDILINYQDNKVRITIEKI